MFLTRYIRTLHPLGRRLSAVLLSLIFLANSAPAQNSTGLKLPLEQDTGIRNRLGFKTYKPVLTVKKFARSTVEYDIETASVVETITLPGDDGEMVLEVHYWSILEYLEHFVQEKEDTLFNEISSKYVTGEEATRRAGVSRGLMPEINLPDFMPKSLASIIGEGTGSLIIHGRSVTEISGKTTYQKPEDQSLFRQQSKFPRLKLEQRQQISIEGTIGTKIHVFVDYNSQNQFENRNRIEVRYEGEEDEILQSLELGDVNLQLPPSMLVSASIPRGNFGIMGQTRLGALTTTFVASQEEGESSQKNINIPVSGEAEATDSLQLWDVNYSLNRHFLLVDTSLIASKHLLFLDRNGVKLKQPSKRPKQGKIKVYKDDGIKSNNNQGFYQARAGFIYVDPDPRNYDPSHPEFNPVPDPDDEFGFYNEMEINKDYMLEQCGIVITFISWVRPGERIGIIYETEGGEEIGGMFNDTLRMKMIKSSSMTSQNPAWPFMLRNVYSFGGGSAVNAQSFSIDIFTNESPPRYDEGELTFMTIFGLDNDEDTKLDRIYVDFTRGLIFFPSLEPFSKPYNNKEELFDLLVKNRRMYIEDDPSRLNTLEHQKYQMLLRYNRAEGTSARTFDLGAMQIIENSERITVNGRQLTRGTHYTIDYQIGQLTLNPSVEIPPNSEVKVDFEEVPLFATGNTSLFGFHNEYEFDPQRKNYLTSTMFFQSIESVDRTFVRLGDEPKTSLLGEFGGKFEFDSERLTGWLNYLPGFQSRVPSRLNMVGGLAFSNPNPNTRGGVLIEDFETTKIENPRLMMHYQAWRLGSVPKDADGTFELFEPIDAGNIFWFDPNHISQRDYGFYEEDIYGMIEGRFPTHSPVPVNVNSVVFEPKGENSFERRRSWRSITQVVSETGVLGMDEREFIQIYISTGMDQGKLILDFGQVNEDQVRFNIAGELVGYRMLDTEDKNFDGSLDIGEDTGLDQVEGVDPKFGGPLVEGDDGNDDFVGPLHAVGMAHWLNLTEGNNKGQIGTNFDTEDLNSNGALDEQERVFRIVVDLEKLELVPPPGVFIPEADREIIKDRVPFIYDPNKLTARNQYVEQLGWDDWYLVEIPLPKEGTRFWDFYQKINNPSLSKVLHVRLTFHDFFKHDTVNFAAINFVGNRFKRDEEGVMPRLAETFIDTAFSDTLWPSPPEETAPENAFLASGGYHGDIEISSVNTILNNEYYPPSSVRATLNKYNRSGRQEDFTAQEAALAIHYRDLQRNYEGWALKAENNQQSYLDYASMSFYVNGRQGPNDPKPTFFVRIGTDRNNFYEYSMPVDTGWTAVTVPFDGFLALKDSLQGALTLKEIQGFKLDVKSGPYRIKGNPSLTKISIMAVGVANETSDIPLSGTVWVDDVLLTNVIREFGLNSRLQLEAQFSDLGRLNFSVSARDNKFRNLNESIPRNSSFDYMLGGSLNIDRFTPERWGIRLPLNIRKTFRRSLPRFHPGSEDVTISLPENKDANKTESTSHSLSISYSKTRGESRLSRYIFNNLTGTMSYNRSRTIAPKILNSTTSISGRLSYRATLPRDAEVSVFPKKIFGFLDKVPLPYFLKRNNLTRSFREARFRYMPSDFELRTSGDYRKSQRFDQISRNFRLDSLFNTQSGVRVNYRPFVTTQSTYNLNVTRNMLETTRGSKLLGFNIGNEIRRQQNLNLQLAPKLVPWLQPNFRYDASYQNDHSPQYVRSFPEGNDFRKFDTSEQQTASLRFSLPQFRSSLAGIQFTDPTKKKADDESEASSSAAYSRQARPQAGKPEGGGFLSRFIFSPINYFLDSFDPFTVQSTLSNKDRWERMPRNPGLFYQFGLKGLSIEERIRETVGPDGATVIDTANFSLYTWNFTHAYQSGLRILDTRFNFNYLEQGGNNHSINGYQFNRTTGPEMNFDYSNIYLPYFAQRYLNRLGFSSGYQIKKGIRGNSVKIDEQMNPLGIESITREERWNPKIRIQANWGRTGKVQTQYSKTETIKTDELVGQDRRQVTQSKDDDFTLRYSFSAPGGLKIPFLSKVKLQSNVRTSLGFRRRLSRNFTEVLDNLGKVAEILINRDTEDITVTPTLGYDFAQVIGNISASYNSHKDRKSGTTRITITMKLSVQLDF